MLIVTPDAASVYACVLMMRAAAAFYFDDAAMRAFIAAMPSAVAHFDGAFTLPPVSAAQRLRCRHFEAPARVAIAPFVCLFVYHTTPRNVRPPAAHVARFTAIRAILGAYAQVSAYERALCRAYVAFACAPSYQSALLICCYVAALICRLRAFV